MQNSKISCIFVHNFKMLPKNPKKQLKTIYKILLKNYGQQGWWPVTPDGKVTPEYHKGDYSYPKTDKQFLEILQGAILTPNTHSFV